MKTNDEFSALTSALVDRWKSASVLDLWHAQVRQHHGETYRSIPLAKFPQDLWSYEKLIGEYKPEIILEIGVNHGGFTQWLSDRMLLLELAGEISGDWLIHGIDVECEKPRGNLQGNRHTFPHIRLHEGNLLDPNFLEAAVSAIESTCKGRRTLMIEDSGHSYETTKASLTAFSPLVENGGWFIVEDTCVDVEGLRETAEWPRGALKATLEFLEKDLSFKSSPRNEDYMITCHPFGFLQRKC